MNTSNQQTGTRAMNNYSTKTIAELEYIQKDAYEAAKFAQEMGNTTAEAKYLYQVNDASTELYKRRNTI